MDSPSFHPALSLVVLTRNRQSYLQRFLESLFSQVRKNEDGEGLPDDGHVEVLIVDDGSTDGTENLIRFWQARHRNLRYIRQDHRGIPAARNNGLRNCKGQIIAFVADDYRLPPGYISSILEFFKHFPQAKILRFRVVSRGFSVASRVNAIRYEAQVRRALQPGLEGRACGRPGRLRLDGQPSSGPQEASTTRHRLEASGGAAFRREVFSDVGDFDECLKRAEDVDFARRAREINIPIYLNPAIKIEHAEGLSFPEVISKNFRSGFYQAWFELKSRDGDAVGPSAHRLELILAEAMGSPSRLLSQAALADSHLTRFLSLPILLAFELSHGLGFGWGLLRYNPRFHSWPAVKIQEKQTGDLNEKRPKGNNPGADA